MLTGIITSSIVGCLGVFIKRCARRRCWRVSSPSPVPTSVDNNAPVEPEGDLLSLGNPTTPTLTSAPEQLALPSSEPARALPAPQPVLALTNGPVRSPPPPPPLPPQQDTPVGLLYEIQGERLAFNIHSSTKNRSNHQIWSK